MPVSSCTNMSLSGRDQLLEYAWYVIDAGLADKSLHLPKSPENKELHVPRASFVTLLSNGQLRGCIGSIQATEPLWQNVCKNAYASGFKDSRFEPLRQHERSTLSLEISILSELSPIDNRGETALRETLEPGKDGLILEQGFHRAVFLPLVWDSLPTPELFINALKSKGGWPENYWSLDISIHTFTTEVIE